MPCGNLSSRWHSCSLLINYKCPLYTCKLGARDPRGHSSKSTGRRRLLHAPSLHLLLPSCRGNVGWEHQGRNRCFLLVLWLGTDAWVQDSPPAQSPGPPSTPDPRPLLRSPRTHIRKYWEHFWEAANCVLASMVVTGSGRDSSLRSEQ